MSPTCCSCGQDMGNDYEVVCDHGYSMHEDVCNVEHEGLDDPCPVGRRTETEIVETQADLEARGDS